MGHLVCTEAESRLRVRLLDRRRLFQFIEHVDSRRRDEALEFVEQALDEDGVWHGVGRRTLVEHQELLPVWGDIEASVRAHGVRSAVPSGVKQQLRPVPGECRFGVDSHGQHALRTDEEQLVIPVRNRVPERPDAASGRELLLRFVHVVEPLAAWA